MANSAKKWCGGFLGNSTSEHPVFLADSLGNTIGNTPEQLSLNSAGEGPRGRMPTR
jgi:hypothetical protein